MVQNYYLLLRNILKEIGCSEMFLITDKGNPRACHVYEKLGGKMIIKMK